MAALTVSPDQADLLANLAASDSSSVHEGASQCHEDPAGILSAHDKLAPLVRLIRGLREQREIVEPAVAKSIVVSNLGCARESVGSEHEALVHVRAGNAGYFFPGKNQEQSERATQERIDALTQEAVSLRALLDLLNGKSPEAVTV